MKKSPRQLSPFAQELFEEIKGRDFLNAHKMLFFDYIDKKVPRTAYDVEKISFAACWEQTHLDIFNELKLFVYNAPMRIVEIEGKEEKVEITLDGICATLAIPLRDMYLEAHPEIPQ